MDTLTYLRDGVVSTVSSIPSTTSMYTMGMGTIGGDAHYFDDAITPAEIREYLNSNKEPDSIKGLKWLLAMISKGQDVAEYLPEVVKNIVTRNLEIKKMVYFYLVHYADYNAACRDISLLSINSFQKDLSGTNQLIRGLALRVMTSIRVPDIIQIQLLAVRNCANDISPYVRKCAATAIAKLFYLDPEQMPHIQQILQKLLVDTSTMVLGSAIVAYNEVCPHNYELLHPCYRKVCHLLADIDEWSQIVVLDVLARYLRHQFKNPIVSRSTKRMGTASSTARIVVRRVQQKAFYSDDEDDASEEELVVEEATPEAGSVFTSAELATDSRFQDDHKMALKASLPLLKSRNAGVVLGVCGLHFYCGSDDANTSTQIAKALVRILRNRREIQLVILNSIRAMARERPYMFQNYLQDFFVKASDPLYNRLCKLDILCAILCKENCIAILQELETYAKQSNKQFVSAVVDCIYLVALQSADAEAIQGCLRGLKYLLQCYKGDALAGGIANNIRKLVLLDGSKESKTRTVQWVARLVLEAEASAQQRRATTALHEAAMPAVAWLIGEHCDTVQPVLLELLRVFARRFPSENVASKSQLLAAAVKMSLCLPESDMAQSIMMYILEMARYDVDVDLRDRSRMMTALMGMVPSTENTEQAPQTEPAANEDALEELTSHARSTLLQSKPLPVPYYKCVELSELPQCNIGSLSAQVGSKAAGYKHIPAWAAEDSDSALRISRETATASDYEEWSKRAGAKHKESAEVDASLRQFYDSKDSSDSEGESVASAEESEESVASSEESDEEESDDSEDESSSSSGSSAPQRRKPAVQVVQPVVTRRPPQRPTQAVTSPMLHTPLHKIESLLDTDSYPPAPAVEAVRPVASTTDAQILAQLMESFPRATAMSEPVVMKPMASPAPASTVPLAMEVLSFPPKILIRSELAGGLQVTLRFRHGIHCSQISGGSSMVLSIENKKTNPIRRLRVNFPSDVMRTYLDDIPSIEGGQIIVRALEISLGLFAGKSIRIDVQSDLGMYSGTLAVETHELLVPMAMTEESFDALKKRLGGGFNETSREVPVGSSTELSRVVLAIRSLLNVAELASSRPGAFKLAGCYRKGMSEDSVLVSGSYKDTDSTSSVADKTLVLVVNCSDAVMCATLVDFVKKNLGQCLREIN